MIVIAYENGDPADVHCLSQEMCESYWLEWLTRLQQFRKKSPERIIIEPDVEFSETAGNEMYESHKFETTDSLKSRSVNSIGVAVASLGKIIKEEDIIDDEKVIDDEEFPASKKRFYGLFALLAVIKSPEAWKKLCENILQHFPFRGKNK